MKSDRAAPSSDDSSDERRRELVFPKQWKSPDPSRRYHLVVIGGGAAGLVTAAAAAGLGARVALVEKQALGGDCLNTGCVPSKALLRAAKAAYDQRRASDFGITANGPFEVDFPFVMARMRRLRAELAQHDSALRFRGLGVDVFLCEARFIDAASIDAGGRRLSFRRACIATGADPTVPPIAGLKECGYLTNESLFDLNEIPRRLAVIGGGPIGTEMAQCFARFGSQVTIFEALPGIMPNDDPTAVKIVEESLLADGVAIETECDIERIEVRGNERVIHHAGRDRSTTESRFDEILVAAGRMPQVRSLELENAGVDFDPAKGIHVDDRLRTSARHIFAAGDVASRYKFTHAADAMARIVVQNALFPLKARASALHIPWCTYTDPELAHVGLTPRLARERGVAIDTYDLPFRDLDRARLDAETAGLARVHVRKGSDRIVGGTIVARNAGDLIGQVTLAMTARLGLGAFSKTIQPYPTRAEIFRRLGDEHRRTAFRPAVRALVDRYLAWLR